MPLKFKITSQKIQLILQNRNFKQYFFSNSTVDKFHYTSPNRCNFLYNKKRNYATNTIKLQT